MSPSLSSRDRYLLVWQMLVRADTFSATPQRNTHRAELHLVNASEAYPWRPAVSSLVDVTNIFNEPQTTYLWIKDRPQHISFASQTFTFGSNGRFGG